MDLTTIAQQSPFVVVSVAFLWSMKVMFDERKADRKERTENSKLMVSVIVDNTAAFNNSAVAMEKFNDTVKSLNGERQ